jgi:hypothetical protein
MTKVPLCWELSGGDCCGLEGTAGALSAGGVV